MVQDASTNDHSTGYGGYVLIWLCLMGLTVLTVAVAGIDLAGYTLPVAMTVAAIKSILVINIFMHIKYDDLIFKAFLGITGAILLAVFLLTALDYITR